MNRFVGFFVSIFSAWTVAAADLPTAHDPNSKIWLDYSDLDYVLSRSVLDMGPSTHQRAHRASRDTATRLYVGSRKASRFEGNRVAFHAFEDNHRQVLYAIRNDLLKIPSQLNLEELSRNQQLAYWFNLHNAIVLAEIADAYPVTNLKSFFDRENEKALINDKQYAFGGQAITIADIQDHILANWTDPLVIYGFYFGAVGTPNIQQAAFAGDTVYDQLRQNARNFVNSVRGTQIWDKDELSVATYYERMGAVFPDFDRDVLRHVEEYARPAFARRLVGISSVDPEIDDWNIADLYNGRLTEAGGIYAKTTQDAEGNFISNRKLPLHVVHALKGRANNFKRFKGTVEIEELGEADEESKGGDDDNKN